MITQFLKRITIFGAISGIVGGFSLFSMFQEFLEFGLTNVLIDFVHFYRTLTRWAFGWIGWPTQWRLLPEAREILALQVLCSGILIRSGAIRDMLFRSPSTGELKPASLPMKMFIVGTPWSIALCFMTITTIMEAPFRKEQSIALPLQVLPFIAVSIISMIVIFALNAYGLSASNI